MSDPTCMYCTHNEALQKLMIYIGDVGSSKLYLFRDQTYRGRCIIAWKEHVNEFFDLTEEEAQAFALDMKRVSAAISKAFAPKKVNLGMYNDRGTHLHCHIVPKYEGGHMFGSTFAMNPEPATFLTEAEYQEIIEKIKVCL